MRRVVATAWLVTGCASFAPPVASEVAGVAGCYRVDFGAWQLDRDSVAVPAGAREFALTIERAERSSLRTAPPAYKVRTVSGPGFGDAVPPNPFEWDALRRRGGGFFIAKDNGQRGLFLLFAPSDSGLAGRARIWHADPLAHDTLFALDRPWEEPRKASRTVATARIRAVRIGCDSVAPRSAP
jgi:hypothetical protein